MQANAICPLTKHVIGDNGPTAVPTATLTLAAHASLSAQGHTGNNVATATPSPLAPALTRQKREPTARIVRAAGSYFLWERLYSTSPVSFTVDRLAGFFNGAGTPSPATSDPCAAVAKATDEELSTTVTPIKASHTSQPRQDSAGEQARSFAEAATVSAATTVATAGSSNSVPKTDSEPPEVTPSRPRNMLGLPLPPSYNDMEHEDAPAPKPAVTTSTGCSAERGHLHLKRPRDPSHSEPRQETSVCEEDNKTCKLDVTHRYSMGANALPSPEFTTLSPTPTSAPPPSVTPLRAFFTQDPWTPEDAPETHRAHPSPALPMCREAAHDTDSRAITSLRVRDAAQPPEVLSVASSHSTDSSGPLTDPPCAPFLDATALPIADSSSHPEATGEVSRAGNDFRVHPFTSDDADNSIGGLPDFPPLPDDDATALAMGGGSTRSDAATATDVYVTADSLLCEVPEAGTGTFLRDSCGEANQGQHGPSSIQEGHGNGPSGEGEHKKKEEEEEEVVEGADMAPGAPEDEREVSLVGEGSHSAQGGIDGITPEQAMPRDMAGQQEEDDCFFDLPGSPGGAPRRRLEGGKPAFMSARSRSRPMHCRGSSAASPPSTSRRSPAPRKAAPVREQSNGLCLTPSPSTRSQRRRRPRPSPTSPALAEEASPDLAFSPTVTQREPSETSDGLVKTPQPAASQRAQGSVGVLSLERESILSRESSSNVISDAGEEEEEGALQGSEKAPCEPTLAPSPVPPNDDPFGCFHSAPTALFDSEYFASGVGGDGLGGHSLTSPVPRAPSPDSTEGFHNDGHCGAQAEEEEEEHQDSETGIAAEEAHSLSLNGSELHCGATHAEPTVAGPTTAHPFRSALASEDEGASTNALPGPPLPLLDSPQASGAVVTPLQAELDAADEREDEEVVKGTADTRSCRPMSPHHALPTEATGRVESPRLTLCPDEDAEDNEDDDFDDFVSATTDNNGPSVPPSPATRAEKDDKPDFLRADCAAPHEVTDRKDDDPHRARRLISRSLEGKSFPWAEEAGSILSQQQQRLQSQPQVYPGWRSSSSIHGEQGMAEHPQRLASGYMGVSPVPRAVSVSGRALSAVPSHLNQPPLQNMFSLPRGVSVSPMPPPPASAPRAPPTEGTKGNSNVTRVFTSSVFSPTEDPSRSMAGRLRSTGRRAGPSVSPPPTAPTLSTAAKSLRHHTLSAHKSAGHGTSASTTHLAHRRQVPRCVVSPSLSPVPLRAMEKATERRKEHREDDVVAAFTETSHAKMGSMHPADEPAETSRAEEKEGEQQATSGGASESADMASRTPSASCSVTSERASQSPSPPSTRTPSSSTHRIKKALRSAPPPTRLPKRKTMARGRTAPQRHMLSSSPVNASFNAQRGTAKPSTTLTSTRKDGAVKPRVLQSQAPLLGKDRPLSAVATRKGMRLRAAKKAAESSVNEFALPKAFSSRPKGKP